ncbi:MAG: GGDEF domain-containing response regulator [Planctomycetota bacterium]|jgi:diguanylate cyclase (GGDEF)-like protein
MRDKETGKPRRVLVISSELDALDEHCRQLRAAGWRVIPVTEEIDGLAAVRRRSIDVVVLHWSLEDLVDMDFVDVLRHIYPGACLPVMVLVCSPHEKARCQYLDDGADDVVCELSSTAEFVSRVRALLRIKELHDELDDSHAALGEALQRERRLMRKLRRDNEHLQQLCTTDSLTHVANVRSFREMLEHEFKVAKRYDQPISLLMIDADHFKVINDTHGHPSGDYVLKEMAVIFAQSVRESDVVARVGGEEFAVILPKADSAEARSFAERIRRAVFERHFEVFGQDIHATVSVGLAAWPTCAEIVEHDMLLYFADQALLLAKETGRDRVVHVSGLDMAVRHRMRRDYKRQARFEAEEAELLGRPLRPDDAPLRVPTVPTDIPGGNSHNAE